MSAGVVEVRFRSRASVCRGVRRRRGRSGCAVVGGAGGESGHGSVDDFGGMGGIDFGGWEAQLTASEHVGGAVMNGVLVGGRVCLSGPQTRLKDPPEKRPDDAAGGTTRRKCWPRHPFRLACSSWLSYLPPRRRIKGRSSSRLISPCWPSDSLSQLAQYCSLQRRSLDDVRTAATHIIHPRPSTSVSSISPSLTHLVVSIAPCLSADFGLVD